MRAFKPVVIVIFAVLTTPFLVATAAQAALVDGASVSGNNVTYTPPQPPFHGGGFLDQTFSVVDPDHSKVHVSVPSGLLVRANWNAGGALDCPDNGDGSFDCDVRVDSATIDVQYFVGDLDKSVASKATATFSSTVSIAGTDASDTASVLVRPKADLLVNKEMLVRAITSTTYGLAFNIINTGPSGDPVIKAVVTGFHTRPDAATPTGCAWSSLTLTCTYRVSNDSGGGAEIVPIATGDKGCSYTVKVSGLYADPVTSNNTRTIAKTPRPCGTASHPTATPTAPGAVTTKAPSVSATQPGTTAAATTAPATVTTTTVPSQTAADGPAPTAPIVSASVDGQVLAGEQNVADSSSNRGHTTVLTVTAIVVLVAVAALGTFMLRRRRQRAEIDG